MTSTENRSVHPLRIFFRISLFIVLLLHSMFPAGPAGASGDDAPITELLKLNEKWTGDFDGMVKRRVIRALVTYSKTNYFLDGFEKRGVTYELLREFETYINKKLKTRHLKIHLVVIPVARDQLIPALIDGRGDIAAAALTITTGREKVADFADPLFKGVNEIVACSPNVAPPSSLKDLSGKEIYVRRSSSYWESLSRLNESLKKTGKPQVKLKPADELLEDEDLLEMVNAGLIPMVVVDDYLARFWSQIFKEITLCPSVVLNRGGEIAWMIRKNTPKLKEVINAFIKRHKKGTLLGNIMFKRYLQNTDWVRNSLTDEELERFKTAVPYFREYAGKYGFDWLRIAAVAYQESRIDQSKRSPAGAVGVMQLLPSTASGDPINISTVEKMEDNIHAGVKYLRWIYETYFEDEDMDQLNKALFAIASYNAGPARIRQLRKEAPKMGLDPNVWFRNVEVVAAKRIGRETVQYVSNIYKYYVAYRLLIDQLEKKETATKPGLKSR
ncbi:MAG: transporter substrate-binding domain-containing protein [Desulfobacterales bacterium]|nr:transporter substrate-binding domain-containing protein [Desulfobacterales bacterium]MBL7173491.1 transporter substrate-binding domain-containing protein [Desulfobacteraceae bacterium]